LQFSRGHPRVIAQYALCPSCTRDAPRDKRLSSACCGELLGLASATNGSSKKNVTRATLQNGKSSDSGELLGFVKSSGLAPFCFRKTPPLQKLMLRLLEAPSPSLAEKAGAAPSELSRD